MSKRFSEAGKWLDPWFRALSPDEKLLFLFLIDNCDLAGFYQIDEETIAYLTRMDARAIQGAWEGLARGLIVRDDSGGGSVVWVKNFLRHQKNLPLNPANRAHQHIIKILESRTDLFPECLECLAPCKGLASPTGIGKVTADQLFEIDVPEKLRQIPGFEKEWREFVLYRQEGKEPMTERAAKMALNSLADFSDPIGSIRTSIMSGWTGLFPTKGKPDAPKPKRELPNLADIFHD